MSHSGNILILTGERDSGKSRLCEEIVNELVRRGVNIKGILSPGEYKGGKKSGILCKEIASAEEKTLAQYFPGWDLNNPQREWLFNASAIEWGNDVLARSIPSEVLIIDEIGFMELEKNSGWTNALLALDSGEYKHALVVVRPSLLGLAHARYPQAKVREVSPLIPPDNLFNEMVSLLSGLP